MIGPRRIVCLTEETTELLYLLGEQDRIVGITAYTVRPAQAREEKPVVSAFIQGSIPKIKELKPDLVVGFSDIQAQLAHDLIKEGLNVLILNQRSIAEIYASMQLLGNAIGRASDTSRLIQNWQTKLIQIGEEANHTIEKSGQERLDFSQQGANQSESRKPRVFFQEWDEPIISGIHWVSELIEIAGGIDICEEKARQPMAQERIMAAQEILKLDPEIIIGSWCGKPVDFSWLKNHPTLGQTTAARENQLFEIDSSIILQPGPALFVEGLDKLRTIIRNWQLRLVS